MVVAGSLGTALSLSGLKPQPCQPITPIGARPPYRCLIGTLPPGSPTTVTLPPASSSAARIIPNQVVVPDAADVLMQLDARRGNTTSTE